VAPLKDENMVICLWHKTGLKCFIVALFMMSRFPEEQGTVHSRGFAEVAQNYVFHLSSASYDVK
jgi:hypothetical protein